MSPLFGAFLLPLVGLSARFLCKCSGRHEGARARRWDDHSIAPQVVLVLSPLLRALLLHGLRQSAAHPSFLHRRRPRDGQELRHSAQDEARVCSHAGALWDDAKKLMRHITRCIATPRGDPVNATYRRDRAGNGGVPHHSSPLRH